MEVAVTFPACSMILVDCKFDHHAYVLDMVWVQAVAGVAS